MSLVTNWITKLPRLKNSKVARFSYKAEAYANDDIEGVENYDYARDMNIPLATHTDFDPDMLSVGARTNFSSIPKNGLNHFFGRVSYNLNKVIDFLVDFLTDFVALNDDFISFTEIVSFSSSATLSNYADGATKRLLNTAGSTITITLPAGETYLGNDTILLAPSIMLTITKRGTVWINSSGNAITAITATTATTSLACSGNSDTATKLQTARKINGVDFDGTADIYDTYSTAEHRIGTWIDGKPLYRKVVSIGGLKHTGTTTTNHNISNLEVFTRITAIVSNAAFTLFHAEHKHYLSTIEAFELSATKTSISIQSYGKFDMYTYSVAILEYTKTTD